jgi:alkylhydroperoxidase family enzyme
VKRLAGDAGRAEVCRILGGLETPYSAKIARLRRAGLEQPGALSPQERRECAEGEPPARLAADVQKVRRRAYTVTDADLAALREAGCSEEEIFEATVCAALGAGLARLERGLALLGEDHR